MNEVSIKCDQCGNEIHLHVSGAARAAGLGIPPVKLIWPNGQVEEVNWSRLRGLTREINGEHCRPVSMTCDIDLSMITHEPTRRRVSEHFRQFGVHVLAM